jgi:hypothetical protein
VIGWLDREQRAKMREETRENRRKQQSLLKLGEREEGERKTCNGASYIWENYSTTAKGSIFHHIPLPG